ncbi:MAG: hypothetical protein R6W67_12110 [Bacteroidales bacterium]
MKTNRRKFISSAAAGSLALATMPFSGCSTSETSSSFSSSEMKSRYTRLNEIIREPLLKRELFTDPVIINTLELLRYGRSYL